MTEYRNQLEDRECDALMSAAPDLLAACEKAEQLASVACDWNLNEVEIDGHMVSTYVLIEEFRAAIAKARGGEK